MPAPSAFTNTLFVNVTPKAAQENLKGSAKSKVWSAPTLDDDHALIQPGVPIKFVIQQGTKRDPKWGLSMTSTAASRVSLRDKDTQSNEVLKWGGRVRE